jgi:hypothetical protein
MSYHAPLERCAKCNTALIRPDSAALEPGRVVCRDRAWCAKVAGVEQWVDVSTDSW